MWEMEAMTDRVEEILDCSGRRLSPKSDLIALDMRNAETKAPSCKKIRTTVKAGSVLLGAPFPFPFAQFNEYGWVQQPWSWFPRKRFA